MNKKDLENKVREISRGIAERTDKIETPVPTAFKYADILAKFPKLTETLITLMSEEFTVFVDDIEWVAPRPTTFKITLKNHNYFYLIWTDPTFTARVSGTQYNLASLGEEQRAIKAIQELLIIGPINPDKGFEKIPDYEEPKKSTPTPEPKPEKPTPEPLAENLNSHPLKGKKITLSENLGLFNSGEKLLVNNITLKGEDLHVEFVNNKGVKDIFIFDKDEKF